MRRGATLGETSGGADVPARGTLVFVATVNGELAVFRQLSTGGLDPDPVFRTVVEGSIGGFGSIGAFGSIVVANLVPDPNDMPEVYLAGSSGIRRFDFQ